METKERRVTDTNARDYYSAVEIRTGGRNCEPCMETLVLVREGGDEGSDSILIRFDTRAECFPTTLPIDDQTIFINNYDVE